MSFEKLVHALYFAFYYLHSDVFFFQEPPVCSGLTLRHNDNDLLLKIQEQHNLTASKLNKVIYPIRQTMHRITP